MKKFTIFLILAGMISTGFAQWKNNNGRGQGNNNDRNNNGQYNNGQNNNNYNSSALVINTASQKNVTVVIDNNLQYQGNGSGVNVGALNPGMHNIVVYEMRTNFWGKQKRAVVYSNSLYLKPNVETTVNINPFGQANIDERALYQNQNHNNGYYNGKGKKNGHHKRDHDDDDDDNDRDYHRNNGNGRY